LGRGRPLGIAKSTIPIPKVTVELDGEAGTRACEKERILTEGST